MKSYNSDSALRKVIRNAEVKQTALGDFIVKIGTAGNGTLGAIDYLNERTNISIKIVNENQFNREHSKML